MRRSKPANINLNSLSRQNIQLRNELKRKEVELELKNKQLAIEKQIQLSLEKVRARSLAMHRSEELTETSSVLFHELNRLGIHPRRSGFGIYNEKEKSIRVWLTSTNEKVSETAVLGNIPVNAHPVIRKNYEAWKKKKAFEFHEITGKAVKTYYDKIGSFMSLAPKGKYPSRLIFNVYFFSEGSLNIVADEALTEEQNNILHRFANVFDLTYKRFLDLQKAEAQTRESQVELGLERVRARAMAMRKSEEVMDVAGTLFEELQKLNFSFGASSIIIMDKDSGDAEYWIAGFSKSQFPESYPVKYFRHPYHDTLLSAWKKGEKYLVYTLKGKEKKTYDAVLFSKTGYRNIPENEKQLMKGIPSVTFSIAFMKHGALHWGPSALDQDQANVLQRFAQVFEQAYTRFLDLQKAEAQAREATVEAALERVRARALAMQEPEELMEVAQVLRNEMGALGIEELETASIYIQEKDSDTAECWYALKDPENKNKKMVTDQFKIELGKTWVGREMKKFYSSGAKQTSILMKGDKRKEWVEYCYHHSPVFRGYYGENIPDRTYHLNKFSQGYIGAAAPGGISGESWKLLSRAASVFSLAYSRFKDLTQARTDLQRLKEEKQRAESALAELRSAQNQLIHSEKMASLGELTAGIAHEIQNPLNFVNNFSEVSTELITEMKEELAKGNSDAAIDLVEDIKQNLEKINTHGKRADAIVKSMLQHSRSSSGQKELTDINALAEEFLRLAYHGFRAKDQSFNSKFETQFDDTLPKVEVVPQEIGRVILNLINNAFYAVTEKRKNDIRGYEPCVTVTTLNKNGAIEIRVHDNGNGIPRNVREKIFQPFFTTKPTGQGTGLGLSLSYDIVTKGHGGQLKMHTKENEGSEFVIELPI